MCGDWRQERVEFIIGNEGGYGVECLLGVGCHELSG